MTPQNTSSIPTAFLRRKEERGREREGLLQKALPFSSFSASAKNSLPLSKAFLKNQENKMGGFGSPLGYYLFFKSSSSVTSPKAFFQSSAKRAMEVSVVV